MHRARPPPAAAATPIGRCAAQALHYRPGNGQSFRIVAAVLWAVNGARAIDFIVVVGECGVQKVLQFGRQRCEHQQIARHPLVTTAIDRPIEFAVLVEHGADGVNHKNFRSRVRTQLAEQR